MKERYHAAVAYEARGHATYWVGFCYPFMPPIFPWIIGPVPSDVSGRQWKLRDREQQAANAERAQSFSVAMRILQ